MNELNIFVILILMIIFRIIFLLEKGFSVMQILKSFSVKREST